MLPVGRRVSTSNIVNITSKNRNFLPEDVICLPPYAHISRNVSVPYLTKKKWESSPEYHQPNLDTKYEVSYNAIFGTDMNYFSETMIMTGLKLMLKGTWRTLEVEPSPESTHTRLVRWSSKVNYSGTATQQTNTVWKTTKSKNPGDSIQSATTINIWTDRVGQDCKHGTWESLPRL